MQIMAAIKSCHKHAARRAACEATWLPGMQMDWLFLMGNPTPANGGPVLVNTLAIDAPDDFENIGPKIFYACEYAYYRGMDWLFVCDDDTYVHPGRLICAVPYGKDYVGWYRPNGHPLLGMKPYIQGSAYWLSRQAMWHAIGSTTLLQKGPDDCLLGAALYGKVPYTHDGRYEPGPNHDRIPGVANDVITTHKVLPAAMPMLHNFCKDIV